MKVNFNLLLNEDGTNSPNEKETKIAQSKLELIGIELENKINSLLKETEEQYGIFIFPNVEYKKVLLKFLVDPILSDKNLFFS